MDNIQRATTMPYPSHATALANSTMALRASAAAIAGKLMRMDWGMVPVGQTGAYALG